ncbi:MAG: hypothetical protein JWO62_2706 [Acidimicrobiaceae bacterium]|jgi:hypothetical protein|nr:hypothetical protein [Acidimicrobiaceae bacterium]
MTAESTNSEPAGIASDGSVYDRRLPPIGAVAGLTTAVVVAGGIYLAAHLPTPAPLAPAVALLAAAGALLLGNLVMLARVPGFAWGRFFLVARWALLGYLIVAGMLEYVFLLDHTRGAILAVLSAMLAIFAVNVPLLLAYSVARYQPVERGVAS